MDEKNYIDNNNKEFLYNQNDFNDLCIFYIKIR